MIIELSSGKLKKVSQANSEPEEGVRNGQCKFITHKMELHLPHCVYSEGLIPKVSSIMDEDVDFSLER